jgi:hypothetical protein
MNEDLNLVVPKTTFYEPIKLQDVENMVQFHEDDEELDAEAQK